MANGYIKCDNSHISFQELVNSVAVRQISTGDVGIRSIFLDVACVDLEDFIGCDAAFLLTPEELFRRMVVLDTTCNKPAVLFITGT